MLFFLKRRLIEDSTNIDRRLFGVKRRLIEDLTKIDIRFFCVERRSTEDQPKINWIAEHDRPAAVAPAAAIFSLLCPAGASWC